MHFMLVLQYFQLRMAEFGSLQLIVSFNRYDKVRKVLIDAVHTQSYQKLKLFLSKIPCLDLISEDSFSVEWLDKTIGKFVAADNFHPSQIQNRDRILIVENDIISTERQLAIEGRLFPNIQELTINSKRIFINERLDANLGTGLIVWDSSILLAKYLEHNPHLVIGKAVLELGSGTGVVGISSGLIGAKYTLLTDLEYTVSNMKYNLEQNFPMWRNGSQEDILGANITYYSLDSYHQPKYQVGTSSLSRSFPSVNIIEADTLSWGDATSYASPYVNQEKFTNSINDGDDKIKTRRECHAMVASALSDWDVVLGADIVWLEHLVPLLLHAINALCTTHTKLLLSYQVKIRLFSI